jgi:hypothetical protein
MRFAADPSFGEVVRFRFEPRPDITAYELALLMPYLLGKQPSEADWQFMGAEQRHLVRCSTSPSPRERQPSGL